MYQYQYVPVVRHFEMSFTPPPHEEHRSVIDQQASQGWRFVAMIPTRYASGGIMIQYDLVFEREMK